MAQKEEKMRKKIALSLVLMMSVVFSGCSGCGNKKTTTTNRYIAAAGSWKDGSYVKKAAGKNGDFDVTVNIENGTIKNIMCGRNNETADKGEKAVQTVPAEILSAQSVNVDGVSGATITSNAIKEAVAECLADASVK